MRVRQVGGSPKPEEVLYADLVVDASGQGSRVPRWLEEIGYRAPSEEVVDARLVEREDVARTLLEVKNLIEPLSALLRPGILLPVLRRTALLLIKPRPTRSKEPGESPRPSEERVFLRI